MCIIHGKTTHFVRLTKSKQACLQSPVRSGQPIHKSQQVESTWAGQPNPSNNWNSWSPLPSSHNLSNQIRKMDTCPLGDESFLHKLKSHHFSSDIKLKLMWQKAGKASASCHFFLLQPSQSKIKSSHDQTFEAPKNDIKSAHFHTKNVYSQVHEPQMGKLREMWFGGHQGDPGRVPSKGSKVDTWLEVVQSAIGNSDSSCSTTKISSLKACSNPISQG